MRRRCSSTGEALKTDAFLFDMRPAMQFIPSNNRGFVTDKPFRGKNPTFGAPISYYLKAASKQVSLRIKDASGAQIRELAGADLNTARNVGINRVYWDLRHQPLPQATPIAGGGWWWWWWWWSEAEAEAVVASMGRSSCRANTASR